MDGNHEIMVKAIDSLPRKMYFLQMLHTASEGIEVPLDFSINPRKIYRSGCKQGFKLVGWTEVNGNKHFCVWYNNQM